jgi:hypothetical protein
MKTNTKNKIINLKPSEIKKTKIVASARRDGKKVKVVLDGVKIGGK